MIDLGNENQYHSWNIIVLPCKNFLSLIPRFYEDEFHEDKF